MVPTTASSASSRCRPALLPGSCGRGWVSGPASARPLPFLFGSGLSLVAAVLLWRWVE